jgi:hypothetical protein
MQFPMNPSVDQIEAMTKTVMLERDAAEIKLRNMRTVCQLTNFVGNFSLKTALAIEKHHTLLRRYLLSKCQKFADVNKAISIMTPSDILINLTELDLYGVFNIDSYYHFIDNLSSDITSNEVGSVIYNPTQVIISKFPQKVIFVCSQGVSSQICEYARVYFNSDVSEYTEDNNCEITVNKCLPNADAVRECFIEFSKFVKDKLSIGLEDFSKCRLTQPIPEYGSDCTFFKTPLLEHIEVDNIDELYKYIKAGGDIAKVLTNFANCNIKKLSIVNNYVINLPDKKKDLSFENDWIANNDVEDYNTSIDYYNAYQEAGGKMSANIFGRFMKTNGYIINHSGNRRWYTKK